MEELSTPIEFPEYTNSGSSLSSFTDDESAGRPDSASCERDLRMIKSREAFLELFVGATHIDAITYAESPSLIIDLFEDHGVDSNRDVMIESAVLYVSAHAVPSSGFNRDLIACTTASGLSLSYSTLSVFASY